MRLVVGLVLGALAVAGCAGTYPPGVRVPSVEEPYRVAVRRNDARQELVIRIDVGPRAQRKGTVLKAIPVGSDREKVVGSYDGARPQDVCGRAPLFSWCDEASDHLYGFEVTLRYGDYLQYKPTWFLYAPAVDDPNRLVRHEVQELARVRALVARAKAEREAWAKQEGERRDRHREALLQREQQERDALARYQDDLVRKAEERGYRGVIFDVGLTGAINSMVVGRNRLEDFDNAVIVSEQVDHALSTLQVQGDGRALYTSSLAELPVLVVNYPGQIREDSGFMLLQQRYWVIRGVAEYQALRGRRQAVVVEPAW
ncbi:MAG: hypothetical protein OXU20_15700 [Myxococcales bacterium]|nr:hypothetical protein [Myxococcales bacterium]